YVNGTWSSIAPMISSRTYYSSQLLKDGRLYVCGGEYGSGGSSGEVYNPLTNSWTGTPSPGGFVSDANSEILEDGRVLQNIVGGGATMNRIYDPATNTYSNGPTSLGSANESAWIKLPDNSILFININSTQAERYIPATNTWILDQPAPLNIYVQPGSEMGGALLLPDGRAMFIGGTGKTLFYTPSGSTANGTWTIGPDLPSWNIAPFISLPLGVSDGPCAMMVNGKVLLALAQVASIGDTFPDPTLFYTFDPITNQYTQIPSPTGTLLGTINMPTYHGNMLALPNGKILFGHFGSTQYYEFTPTGSPLNSGKPSITSIAQINANTYRLIGTKFNGISQGASYGDDWQMSTNYPIVRISYGTNVFYCRTYNWNSTGVQRGSMADTTYFTVPAGIPITAYNLVVTANGIPSDPIIFNPGFVAGVSVTAGTGVCKGVSTSFIANPVNGGNPGYQWQLNGNNIAGATNSTYTTSTLNSYDQIRCVMTSNIPGIGGNPTTSNPVSIPVHENTAAIQTTLTPTAICRGNNITLTASKEYSIPPYTGGTIYGDNISGVTINGNAGSVLGNYSFGAPSPFYTFYTYSWSGLQANNEYSMNVSMNNSVTSNNSLAAWLDFNQDKSFDPSERILFGTGFSSAYAQLNGTFKVPANAVNGNTRMRVRLVSGNANNNPNAIENFGETEDYLLTITGGSGTIAPTSFDWLANTSPSFGAVVSSTPAYSQQYNVKTTDAYGCYTSVQTTPVLVTDLNIDATVSPAILCPGATASLNAGVDTNYCMPTYTSGGTMMGNYIANLDLYDFSTPFLPIHLMSNFSGASLSPYYTIFPAAGNTTATLNTGGNYTFYFQSGSAAGNVIAAFIDYDQNGDLNPGMEKLGEISIGSNTTGSLTFTVPGWARNGSTRLRIILSTTTNMSSCNPYLSSYSYGETEDYTIQISGGMINTLPTITWSPSTNPSSGNLVNASPSASTTYTVTATDNSGCSSTALAHVLVHTPSPFTVNPASPASICAGETTTLSVTANPVTYCQPAYTFGSGSGDYISIVYLFNPLSTTLSNSSGASASPYYTLYPASGSATTTLTAGYTYYLTVNVGSFSSFNNVAAWIDYNGDGQWFAPMEKLGETGDINSAFGSGTLIFTVPSWAKNGTVRLRIREVYSTYNLDPCATYPYGETEDYSLTITGGISASSTTYAWSPATSPSSGTSVMASPSSNTIYTVTATGSYGCTSTGTSAVTMKTDALFYQNASSVCVSSPVSFTANPNTC
ncbi:MAG TPA: GEVED domain-containing protein, partial [Chitinophagaceae bacterium]|nr:GEVED domain-containing protein [Chitinophagaceae bacterium]